MLDKLQFNVTLQQFFPHCDNVCHIATSITWIIILIQGLNINLLGL